ncbi:MAG: glycosyltransferase [Cyanobacteria bacterium P01_F01_bin.56]
MSALNLDFTSTFRPIKVTEIELSQPLPTFTGLDHYEFLQALVRLQGRPLGYLNLPLENGCCAPDAIQAVIFKTFSWPLVQRLMTGALATAQSAADFSLQKIVQMEPPPASLPIHPLVTVAVCTRDRTADLKCCLDALMQLDYANLEMLIVDNAPSDDATQTLVSRYPQVRYVQELRPGLSWARNRALIEAQGELIAYTDDDVLVDAGWVTALVRSFYEHPAAAAVTGLVAPYELEDESQILFEQHGGFGKGFDPRVFASTNEGQAVPWYLLGTGQCGTGANMAFRRQALLQLGGFNSALGAGTATRGCEDLAMFFQVIKSGQALVYEPAVLVWHRHRQSYAAVRSQLASDGVGLYAYFLHGLLNFPQERWSFLFIALWWLWDGNIRRLWISLKYPNRFPRDLIWAELWGCFRGVPAYFKARQQAQQLATTADFPALDLSAAAAAVPASALLLTETMTVKSQAMAVRTLELSQPLEAIADVADYNKVRIFLNWRNSPLGSIDIENAGHAIAPERLSQAIFDGLQLKLLEPDKSLSNDLRWSQLLTSLSQKWASSSTLPITLPSNLSVSVVLATYDRPETLKQVLQCLVNQDSPRAIEIIVVDNHPASGLTPPVVDAFPSVRLIQEPRQGVSYARNAGIGASHGDIIVMTDDDVTMPTQWLEKLVTPFTRPDVMVVTGNILPLQLETPSQRLFETYGGLGRGFVPFEVNGDWFELFPRKAVPTWTLGATANAAFRSTIFRHPKIGLMDETLGPGMPSGVGEDTYLFYQVLKAGYTLTYRPQAYVWHQHRRTQAALRQQLFNYSKGHVAYHLTTLLRDGDGRGLVQILAGLPLAHASRIYSRLRGWSAYPISLVLWEMLGNLVGPWALLQSRLRVMGEGLSAPYVPPAERSLSVNSIPAPDPAQPRQELLSNPNSSL